MANVPLCSPTKGWERTRPEGKCQAWTWKGTWIRSTPSGGVATALCSSGRGRTPRAPPTRNPGIGPCGGASAGSAASCGRGVGGGPRTGPIVCTPSSKAQISQSPEIVSGATEVAPGIEGTRAGQETTSRKGQVALVGDQTERSRNWQNNPLCKHASGRRCTRCARIAFERRVRARITSA